MSDDDIDLDRVVADPEYRRRVIAFLSEAARIEREETPRSPATEQANGPPA